MITLKQFMETCGYRITEGSEYGWSCFGHNAYSLDSWNGNPDGHTLSIVFDTRTQEVYQALAYDYSRERAYRITNPEYQTQFNEETQDRGVLDVAWELDDGTPVAYTDLDLAEDFIEKAWAICNDQEYDTRVQVQVEFTDEELLRYMKFAHDRDITFNQLVEEALKAAIAQAELLKAGA